MTYYITINYINIYHLHYPYMYIYKYTLYIHNIYYNLHSNPER